MVRLLPGTNIQKCRAINLESSWLVCLHCLCSSTEDVERRWGHLRELPGSLRWHWNFMVSGFDWYFLIHVFHSVEGVFKQGSLSHSVKQCWPNWGGERLCCRDMAGPWNKKPFCFSEQKGRCISNFGGDHRILETSTGFLQRPYSQPVKAVGALFKTAVLQSKPSAYKLEFLLKLPRNWLNKLRGLHKWKRFNGGVGLGLPIWMKWWAYFTDSWLRLSGCFSCPVISPIQH